MRKRTVTLPGDQTELTVNFILWKAVYYPTAGIFKHLRVVNVILLIKAGTQLQKAENIFPLIRRIGKSRCHLAAD